MMFYLYAFLILPFNKINGIVVTGSKSSNHTSDRDCWDLFGGGGGRLRFSLICGRPVWIGLGLVLIGIGFVLGLSQVICFFMC